MNIKTTISIYYKLIVVFCIVILLASCGSKKTIKDEGVSLEKKLLFQTYYIDACTYYNIENYQQAAKLFKKCAELLPKEASTYHYLSLISVKDKKYNDALNFAQKAHNLAQNNKFYCSHYSYWLRYHGQYELAQSVLEKNIFSFNPIDEKLCIELDDLLRINNQTERRIKLWQNFNEKSNNYNKKAILKLIELYTIQKNFVEVHNYYAILQKASPSNVQFLYEDALIYKQEKNFEKYLGLLKKASQIKPTDWFVNIELYEYFKSKQNNEFFTYLGNALQDSKTEFNKKTKFINEIIKQSEIDTTLNPILRNIGQSISLNHSTNSDALYLASDIYFKTKNFDKSLSISKNINSQFPNFYMAWVLTINNQLKLNLLTEANESCEQALTFFPTNGQLYILSSQCALLNKNYNLAFESANQSQKFIIDDSLKCENFLYLAQSLFYLNKLDEAMKNIEKALNLNSEKAILYDWKGNILSKQNLKEKAIENWKIAQQKGDNSVKLQNKISKGVWHE